MTPEEAEQLRQHLTKLRAQQEAAAKAQAERQQREQKAQLYSALGAIGGAALGIGLLKLLNRDKGQAKAEELMEDIGDQCTGAVKQKLAGFLGTDGESPMFRPDDHDGEIKDADFEIVD